MLLKRAGDPKYMSLESDGGSLDAEGELPPCLRHRKFCSVYRMLLFLLEAAVKLCKQKGKDRPTIPVWVKPEHCCRINCKTVHMLSPAHPGTLS